MSTGFAAAAPFVAVQTVLSRRRVGLEMMAGSTEDLALGELDRAPLRGPAPQAERNLGPGVDVVELKVKAGAASAAGLVSEKFRPPAADPVPLVTTLL